MSKVTKLTFKSKKQPTKLTFKKKANEGLDRDMLIRMLVKLNKMEELVNNMEEQVEEMESAPVEKESVLKQENGLIVLEKADKPSVNLKATAYKWQVIMEHVETIEMWLSGKNVEGIKGFELRGGFAYVTKGRCSKGFSKMKAKWILEHKEEIERLL